MAQIPFLLVVKRVDVGARLRNPGQMTSQCEVLITLSVGGSGRTDVGFSSPDCAVASHPTKDGTASAKRLIISPIFMQNAS